MFFKILSILIIKSKFIVHSTPFDSAARSSFLSINIFNKTSSEIKAFFQR